MPLQDYLSSDQDDQCEEVAKFLYERWADVLEEEAVLNLRFELDSPIWTGYKYEIREVEDVKEIRARFRFVAKGLDENSKPTGEEITGSAVAVIDDFDNVEFVEVEAEA